MDPDPRDVAKILVATDIHMGVNEMHGIRGNDSFTTFEEILSLAQKHDVDFVLLGGDLFHHNKPSMHCYHKCLPLLRKYCLGDKPIAIEFLSDQAEVFKHNTFKWVNYDDPNMNISIPIFTIHGNHDDPSGLGRLSSLDILSDLALVNYFGKITDLTRFSVKPILLRKRSTQIALYGMSFVSDERLHRLLRDQAVEFERPPGDVKSWFCVLVLHQNRVFRDRNTRYIPESQLPDFMDLIVWGHEHDCRITPELNAEKNFYVTQPGSSVATSLCEGESIPKKVGILRIFSSEFNLKPIPLQTVRPFVFDELDLREVTLTGKGSISTRVMDYISSYIHNNLLIKARSLLTGHPDQPELPLIRLRVFYSSPDHFFNEKRFSQSFSDVVANPEDVILLKRVNETRSSARGKTKEEVAIIEDNDWELFDPTELVEHYFGQNEDKQLKVLSLTGLNQAVEMFVSKSEKDSLTAIVNHQVNKTIKYLQSNRTKCGTNEEITNMLQTYRELRMKTTSVDQEKDELQRVTEFRVEPVFLPRPETHTSSSTIAEINKSFGEVSVSQGRGRGRGRGAKKTETRPPSRSASKKRSEQSMLSFVSVSSQDDQSSSRIPSTRKKARIDYELSD